MAENIADTQRVSLDLPWPPSVNHYWQLNANGSRRISARGKQFRHDVIILCKAAGLWAPIYEPVAVSIIAHPPDRRRRDLDNVLKALLDGMEHGGVYGDDAQINMLQIQRAEVVKPGRILVTVETVRAATLVRRRTSCGY